MTKFLKRVFQLLIALIVILAIATIGIVNFVNPNQFKGVIEREVLANTGYTLTVNGPIQWRWYPMLSLEFNNIAIQNLPPFSGQLLSAKTIEAECKLLPVFMGKIALNVRLKGLDLVLTRNTKGQGNWENLKQPKHTTSSTPEPTTSKSSFAIILSSLMIQEGKIAFNDASKNSQYNLSHVNISLDNLFKGLVGINTPLIVNFELASNNQTISNIFLSTDWALQHEKEQLNLKKIVFKFNQPDGSKNLITGDAEIQGFSKTALIKGNVAGNDLQFGKIKIDKLSATIAAQDGMINLAPIDMQIAKSQQKATLKLDVRGNIPKVSFTQEAQDFEINDMLTLFGAKNKLAGKTRLTLNLSATGADLNTLQNSLSGKAVIEITQGKFYGIDLVTLLKSAQSNVHALIDALTQKLSMNTLSVINTELAKWKTDPNSTAFTPFNTLNATANITNGIIQNPDLSIQDSEYSVNGSGTINIAANSIQYQTTLQLKNNPYPPTDKAGTFLFQTPLNVLIQGNLDDPKIRPDLNRYTNSALEYAQKELVQKVVQKTIGQAIEKATGNSAIQEKLQKAIGNILKP